jgi:hypothetical protein
MRTSLALLISLAIACTSLGSAHSGVPTRTGLRPCGLSLPSALRMLSNYRYVAVLDDSVNSAWRELNGLASVDFNTVVLVTDTVVCRRALNAYNAALLPDTAKSVSVNVVRYGSARHIVSDSARISGEWVPNVIFDTLFSRVIANIGQ